jgi:hypothetical protein
MRYCFSWVAAGVLSVAAIAGCGGDGGSTPTPTSNQTPGFTPATDNGSPEPSPKVEPVPERSGDEALDAIIEGFMQHDTKPLLPLLRYSVIPCEKTPGLGGPPLCRPDQEPGTPVEVMPVAGCEQSYPKPHEFEQALATFVTADLYGVYRAPDGLTFDGDYMLLVSMPRPDNADQQIATEVIVKDGRIAAVDQTCALTPEETVEQDGLGEPLYVP